MGQCSGCGTESYDLTEVPQEVAADCGCGEDDCYVCGYTGDGEDQPMETIHLFYCPPCHETIVIQGDTTAIEKLAEDPHDASGVAQSLLEDDR